MTPDDREDSLLFSELEGMSLSSRRVRFEMRHIALTMLANVDPDKGQDAIATCMSYQTHLNGCAARPLKRSKIMDFMDLLDMDSTIHGLKMA